MGIAGQHIRSLQHSDYITRSDPDKVIEDADIESLKENVHKLVMMPGEEIIHVLPQEYKIDGQADTREPRGMYGGTTGSQLPHSGRSGSLHQKHLPLCEGRWSEGGGHHPGTPCKR